MATALEMSYSRTLEVPAEALHTFSKRAQEELVPYIRELGEASRGMRVDDLAVDLTRCPQFTQEIESTRKVVDSGTHFVIYDRVAGIESLRSQALFTWILGSALGEPMLQNHEGWRLIEVYDRGTGRTIAEGARYHQTKQGAYIHNDGVSDIEPIDYLVLSCAQRAYIGGESVMVDAKTAHDLLLKHPEILDILTGKFWFEKRGMTTEADFFQSPIIKYSAEGEPLVSYFRAYIESAHEQVGEPLSERQREALDFFDAVLDQSSVQYRMRLERGQTMVSADDRFLHTRTTFVDRFTPRVIDMDTDTPDSVNRYMYRVWSRKREASRLP
ncbi:TauD/TfdA family dioxygenase [Streptomyces sp. NBC_01275]|uniref:TauD/TfdA family dioxygenase n=1 Tax=Streptomyces sp. NBC_01275 TaxID=2903807 RepID=UPI00225B6687|nr:TauD/TfdA family dioxygenase [Streptomyces sp. NBC_01275]MCX4763955.1 TauD/TfdA family dioxygenase [Streptomyces sp. NBC_01275]